ANPIVIFIKNVEAFFPISQLVTKKACRYVLRARKGFPVKRDNLEVVGIVFVKRLKVNAHSNVYLTGWFLAKGQSIIAA
ncbi:MAG: hypothetical protein ACI96P_002496, partial [Candidatus Azotimanducaceae bacterium]